MPASTKTGTSVIDGVPWAWEASGEGPCVCLFHGMLSNHTMWDSVVGELAGRYRCITVDWPGHGRSGFDPAGWTAEDLVRGVPVLLADADVERAVFVGFSQGGAISLRVALSRPDLVAGLVTVAAGPAGPGPDGEAWLLRLGKELDAADESGRRAKLTEFQESTHIQGWLQREPDAAESELAALSSIVPQAYPLITLLPGRYVSVEDELGGITCPAMVVFGAQDANGYWGPRMVERMPAARLAVIEDAAHHVPLDAPAEFQRVLAGFLDDLTLPGRIDK